MRVEIDQAIELEQLLESLAATADAIGNLARASRFEEALDALVARDTLFARVREYMARPEAIPASPEEASSILEVLARAQDAQAMLAQVMGEVRDTIRQDLEIVERKLAAGDGYTSANGVQVGAALDVRR